jgi:hypothetical protein
MKEPGDASNGGSSFVSVLVWALLLLLSIVLSSSVFEIEAEVSRLLWEFLLRVDCRTGDWT